MIAAQPITHPPGSQKLMDRYLLTAKAANDAHLNDVLRGFLENTVLKMSDCFEFCRVLFIREGV